MALIKLSSIGITNLSGKAGGSIYSHNRGGSYVRNFAVPSNPSSVAQENVRGVFGGFASSWRGLTEEERTAWRNATDDYLRTNRFGDQKSLSGQQLYISLNRNIQNVGGAALAQPLAPQGTFAPLSLSRPTLEVMAGNLTTATVEFNFSPIIGIDVASMTAVLEATPVVSAGRNFVNNRYRKIASLPMVASGEPLDFKAQYPEIFGIPAIGGKVFLRVKITNNTTGETSTYVSTQVIVEEGV